MTCHSLHGLARMRPAPGRCPCGEHRAVVDAILRVLTGGASWRGLPEKFGPWQTAYYRYAR